MYLRPLTYPYVESKMAHQEPPILITHLPTPHPFPTTQTWLFFQSLFCSITFTLRNIPENHFHSTNTFIQQLMFGQQTHSRGVIWAL